MIRFLALMLILFHSLQAACTKIALPTDYSSVTSGTRANLKANFNEIQNRFNPCADSTDEVRGRFSGYSGSLVMSSLSSLRLKLDGDNSETARLLVESGNGDSLFTVREDSTAKFYGALTLNVTPTLSALTASQAVETNSSKQLVSAAITGTGSYVKSVSPTLTGTLTAAAASIAASLYIRPADGNVAIGLSSPNTNSALDVRSPPGITGVSQYGVISQPTFTSAATTSAISMGAAFTTAAATVDGIGFRVYTPALSGAGAITNAYGILVDNQSVGTNKWALKTGTGKVELGDSLVGASQRLTGSLTAATVVATGNMTADSLVSPKFYTEGSFTVTAQGLSTSPTATARYVRIGKQVTLYLPALSGTSDSTGFTYTGLPTAIQPPTDQYFPTNPMEDNTGSFQVGMVQFGASGTIVWWWNGSATGWTASNIKGTLWGTPFSYTLQ